GKLRRDFLWNGAGEGRKFHLLKWEEVYKPISEGGADIKPLDIMNTALLGKWIWRCLENMKSFHQKVEGLHGILTSPPIGGCSKLFPKSK
ncbi:hypothetical protein PJI17_31920, partial [Mycobacterium kansasii]